jgi:hypothetical protein
VQADVTFSPALHTLQGAHPAAPAEEKDAPLEQVEQNVAPPVEYVPAAQRSTPARLARGFLPAGADLHALAPSASENSPSPLQLVQESTPPADAVPAGQITAAVLSAFDLKPAGTVVQYEEPSDEYVPELQP